MKNTVSGLYLHEMRVIPCKDGGRVEYGFASMVGGAILAGVCKYDEFGRVICSNGRTFSNITAARRVYSLRGLRSIACAWAQ